MGGIDDPIIGVQRKSVTQFQVLVWKDGEEGGTGKAKGRDIKEKRSVYARNRTCGQTERPQAVWSPLFSDCIQGGQTSHPTTRLLRHVVGIL